MSAQNPGRPRARRWLVVELPTVRCLQAGWQILRDSWVRRRIEAQTRAELHGLDERGLRDLGLDRSQIPSVAATVAGRFDARVHDALAWNTA